MKTKNETELRKLFHLFKILSSLLLCIHPKCLLSITYRNYIHGYNVKDNIMAISLVSKTFIKANQSDCTYIHHHLSK